MAKILSEQLEVKARSIRYPWAEWFDGQPRELKHGEDFFITVHSMSVNVYQAARRFGKRVACQEINTTTLRIQAFDPEPVAKLEIAKKNRQSNTKQNTRLKKNDDAAKAAVSGKKAK